MKRLTLFVISALASLTVPAHAVLIDLGSFPNPPGGDNAANELAFLNSTVIPAYNATQPGTANDLPLGLAGTQNINVGGNQLSITLDPSGYEFLKLKWGQNWQYYYVEGLGAGSVFQSTTFNQNNQPQALSHYTFFNSTLLPLGPGQGPGFGVPDGGASILLLGAALTVLGLARRFMS